MEKDALKKTVYYLDKGLIRELVVPNEYYMGYESMVLAAQMARYHTDKMEQVEVDFFRVTKENLYAKRQVRFFSNCKIMLYENR